MTNKSVHVGIVRTCPCFEREFSIFSIRYEDEYGDIHIPAIIPVFV